MNTLTICHIEQLQLLVGEIGHQNEEQWETAFDTGCKALLNQYQNILFSDLPDVTLRRFYNFQLEALLRLTDQAQQSEGEAARLAQQKLAVVLTELTSLYERYIDSDLYIRPSQLAARSNYLNVRIAVLLASPALMQLHPFYQNWLRHFLADSRISPQSGMSLNALKYLETFVSNLSNAFAMADFDDRQLEICLLQNNLNDLAYYAAWTKVQSEKMNSTAQTARPDFLADLQFSIAICPEKVDAIYHQDWPSLKQLQLGWLHELLQCIHKKPGSTELHKQQLYKLALNLSVSQLACLIHLMKANGLLEEECLKDIFKFFAIHFSTKRQRQISPGSLSKEFYSISQKTAAMTRFMLQDMINQINKEFFPA